MLNVSTVFSTWNKAVKEFALTQMQLGVEIPGYKLVKRKSNRVWLNQEMAGSVVVEFLGDDMYTPRKLKSVKQVEDALKKVNASPESLMAGLWEKPDNGLSMVSESDKRKAVDPPAIADFTPIDNNFNNSSVVDNMFVETTCKKLPNFLD